MDTHIDHAGLKQHLEELNSKIAEYQRSGDEASKKALIEYAENTFGPNYRQWIKEQLKKMDTSDEAHTHLKTIEEHCHEITQHLKEDGQKFDALLARANSDAVVQFVERLFS